MGRRVRRAAIEDSRMVLRWPPYGHFQREGLELVDPLVAAVWIDDEVYKVLVPRSGGKTPWFTDLATIPVVHSWGPWDYAAVVHDWIYERKGVLDTTDGGVLVIDRSDADRIFYLLMLGNGVSMVTATAMYAAVRTAGGPYWEDD